MPIRAVLAAALLCCLSPAPALAADRYVALGDSYSSGLGAGGGYAAGGCRRSPLAFPAILARERADMRLIFGACAGARTTDVLARQLVALSVDTALVTITAGGNDAGFADVLTECAKPSWLSDCAGRIRTAESFIRSELPARLDRLYGRVRALAPRAVAVVLGYPRLFAGDDCDLLTWFSRDDEARLNGATDLLAATIRDRARAQGLVFVDSIAAFLGHAVCDGDPWLNGLSSPLAESYHPNAVGQRAGFARLVRAFIG